MTSKQPGLKEVPTLRHVHHFSDAIWQDQGGWHYQRRDGIWYESPTHGVWHQVPDSRVDEVLSNFGPYTRVTA